MNVWHMLMVTTIANVMLSGCDANGQSASTPPSTQPATQPTSQPSGRAISTRLIATYEHEAMQAAVGVAIVDGQLAVSDPQTGVIHMFNLTGQRLGILSPRDGSAPPERPMHLTCDTTGRLFVADYQTDQIIVFDVHSSKVNAFGTPGSERGQFDAPAGVAVADDGSIYVADFNNHRVQRFNAEGRFVRLWGQEGHELGDFSVSQIFCQQKPRLDLRGTQAEKRS